MKIEKLSTDCSNILNNRLQNEYEAMYFYRSAANYCKSVGYEGGYKFFSSEAEQELSHAKKIEDYLSDWNLIPELRSIDKPETFDGLVDIIEKAYKMELDLLEAYNSDALAVLDEYTYVFTFLQEFVKIQDESVREYSDLLNKLELTGTDKFALMWFDKEILGN